MVHSFHTTNKTEKKIIDLAYDMFTLPKKKGAHFTFIVRKKNIMCIGRNNVFKTHPAAKKFGYRLNNIHSELSAIINFPLPVSELCNYTLYNVRIDRTHTINNSYPCDTCLKMLMGFNPKRIFFTTMEKFDEVL